MQLHDLHFKPYIPEKDIIESIDSIADKINTDFIDLDPVFICVLDGAFMFASEVVKRFKGNCEISFTKLKSYSGTETSGKIKTLLGLNISLENRNVIILEDIVDTGNTIKALQQVLTEEKVKSFKIATLFF